MRAIRESVIIAFYILILTKLAFRIQLDHQIVYVFDLLLKSTENISISVFISEHQRVGGSADERNSTTSRQTFSRKQRKRKVSFFKSRQIEQRPTAQCQSRSLCDKQVQRSLFERPDVLADKRN